MKAQAKGRTFEDRSWDGLVSRIVAAHGLKTTAGERVTAASALSQGFYAYLDGVRIEPVR